MGRWIKYETFCKDIEKAAPGCHIEENGDGELVVYTGWTNFEEEGVEYVREMTDKEVIEGVARV